MVKPGTQCLVPAAHAEPECLEHGALKQGVQPRHADEEREEEHAHAGVEGEYVGQRHQGQAAAAEFRPYLIGEQPGTLLQQTQELLEAGGLPLLGARVLDVEEEV